MEPPGRLPRRRNGAVCVVQVQDTQSRVIEISGSYRCDGPAP